MTRPRVGGVRLPPKVSLNEPRRMTVGEAFQYANDKTQRDRDQYLCDHVPTDDAATLVRARAEAAAELRLHGWPSVGVYRAILKLPSGIKGERYYVLTPDVERLFSPTVLADRLVERWTPEGVVADLFAPVNIPAIPSSQEHAPDATKNQEIPRKKASRTAKKSPKRKPTRSAPARRPRRKLGK